MAKAMDQVLANNQIKPQDFVLFAFANTKLSPHFDTKLTVILEHLNSATYQHIDCVLLDYGYLGEGDNLFELVADHESFATDPINAHKLETTKIFEHLKLMLGTVKVIANHHISTTANQPDNISQTDTDITIGIPACMGLSYARCFLIRKSRMQAIRKHRRAKWLVHDFKRYIPISRILIASPSLVHSSYPEYNLAISTEDVLELNRRFVQHTQPIDNYRSTLYQRLPWIYQGITHSNPIIRGATSLLHRVLFWA